MDKLVDVDVDKADMGLSKEQGHCLHASLVKRRQHDGYQCDHGHSHGHAEKPPSILTATASAVINFLLMFGLCCAYGMIMFEDDYNKKHRGLGVKMNLCSALLVGLLLAFFSKVKVAIGGPDLNPVVFLGMFVGTLSEEVAKEVGLEVPSEGRRLLAACGAALASLDPQELFRRLAESSSAAKEFCTGEHYASHIGECDSYHSQLRATSIFSVAVSSAILGLIFFCLGRFRLTRFVTYVPANIMEAFLSCVGYKVFKYALKFCKYKPQQFIPAAAVGVPLYFMKALHMGNPAVVIPVTLFVPLAIFYTIVYGSGGDLASAREAGWMFDNIENVDFWMIWADSLGRPNDINIKAWVKTLPDLAIMIIVCLLDCMLKLSSTENKLPVKADKDYEIQLFGASNILTTLCGSSVGYMQLKFNVINFGVLGNAIDRRAGVIYALLCGATFFWTTDLFNYLPRFFLSTLLFFAGSGFVAENLWGSRKYLSLTEWFHIIVILGIFIFTESLLNAVIIGGLIVGGTFIVRYAHIPVVAGRPMRGGELRSRERRSPQMQRCLQHIGSFWLLEVRLKGYVFFASAQKLTTMLSQRIETVNTNDTPEHKRLHWVILDCSLLDGLDVSAGKAFTKLVALGKSLGVRILWSSMSSEFVEALKTSGTITDDAEWFANQDEAMLFVEGKIQDHVVRLQERWCSVHPMLRLVYEEAEYRMVHDPFADILLHDVSRFGNPWQYCRVVDMKAHNTVLWRHGDRNRGLMLIHSGKVGVFPTLPTATSCSVPDTVYGRGWFVNREALRQAPTTHYAVAIESGEALVWNELEWGRMAREKPRMTAAFLRALILQDGRDAHHTNEEDAGSAKHLARATPEELVAGRADGRHDKMPTAEKDLEKHHGDVRRSLVSLSVAQALGNLGLLSPGSPGTVLSPKVPESLQLNLRRAFRNHTSGKCNGGWGLAKADARLPDEDACQALADAGVVGALRSGKEPTGFDEDGFVALGIEAGLAAFSDSQTAKLRQIFAGYKGPDGLVNRSALITLFQESIYEGMSVEEIDGIADGWCSRQSENTVDESDFLMIMSRLVRLHELDWCVLQVLRHLVGQKEVAEGTRLTPAQLMENNAGPKMTPEEAELLIWFAGVFEPGCGEEGMDVRLVAPIMLPMKVARSKLVAHLNNHIPLEAVASQPSASSHLVDLRSLTPEGAVKQGIPGRLGGGQDVERLQTMDAADVLSEEPEKEANKVPDTCRAKLNLLLDEPSSSPMASRISVAMGIMILISIMTLFLEPLISPKNKNITDTEKKVWFGFEAFFTVLFTVEMIARFLTCDALGKMTKTEFVKSPMNVCDLLAVLPFYIDAVIDVEAFRLLRVIRLLRLSRLVRLGRLSKKSETFAPISVILVVIWGIYMKNGLSAKK